MTRPTSNTRTEATRIERLRRQYYDDSPRDVYAVREDDERRIVYLHDEIMGLAPDSPTVVEHINGNGLDNRRANLRLIDLPRTNVIPFPKRPGA